MGRYILCGKTIKEWSEITGLSPRFIHCRLKNYYHIDDILAPKKKNQVPRGSIKDFVIECSKKQGVTRKAIYQRLNRGWTKKEVEDGIRNSN